MLNKLFSLSDRTAAVMTTYILDDGEYDRKGLKRPAVIICPGGGYTMVSKNEGEPVALFFNRHGYHAFVVNYSVTIENPFPTALCELAKAVSIVKEHKEEWLLADEISVVGFSAGGNLALSLGVFAREKFLTEDIGLQYEDIKPDRLILGYPAVTLHPKRENGEIPEEILALMEQGLMPDFRGPGIREILLGNERPSEAELEGLNLLNKLHHGMPPTFVWGSYEDSVIPASDYTDLAGSLYRLQVPCELHMFGHGPHGVSLCDMTVKSKQEVQKLSMDYWTTLCLKWLEQLRI
ncbi:MAG TPA: alpha/beta hydrolase [Clostridiales bacterium]|nr:alpha/beta hydrolase [Clostridiales bacterium]